MDSFLNGNSNNLNFYYNVIFFLYNLTLPSEKLQFNFIWELDIKIRNELCKCTIINMPRNRSD